MNKIFFNPEKVYALLKEAITEWSNDKPLKLGAALSYYAVFSLPPLLLIVIALAGLFFGEEAVRGQIVQQFQGFVGKDNISIIQTMIAKTGSPQKGIIATIIGVVALILGASGVFGELQDSLNIIWKVKPKPGISLKQIVRIRFLSFSLILSYGFLLLISLVVDAGLAAFGTFLDNLGPGQYVMQAISFVISFGVTTVLFALLLKILPDARIHWSNVWMGSVVTALLFTIGKFLIGLYLGKSSIMSAYGAAGSLIIILLWVYYSSLILFFGAEFTKVYANTYGSGIEPAEYAERRKDFVEERYSIPHG